MLYIRILLLKVCKVNENMHNTSGMMKRNITVHSVASNKEISVKIICSRKFEQFIGNQSSSMTWISK